MTCTAPATTSFASILSSFAGTLHTFFPRWPSGAGTVVSGPNSKENVNAFACDRALARFCLSRREYRRCHQPLPATDGDGRLPQADDEVRLKVLFCSAPVRLFRHYLKCCCCFKLRSALLAGEQSLAIDCLEDQFDDRLCHQQDSCFRFNLEEQQQRKGAGRNECEGPF